MSKRIFTCAGVIHRENGTSASGSAQRQPGLLGHLADRRRPQRRVPLALVAVDGAPGKHPGAAHEARLRVALDEQQLQPLGPAAQEDHRRRETRHGRRAVVQLLAGAGTVDLHARDPTRYPSAAMKWMCESCGFIYDPEEGDPDGGIPPGTRFEDIPDTWFCPVCGARKRDFTPYDD